MIEWLIPLALVGVGVFVYAIRDVVTALARIDGRLHAIAVEIKELREFLKADAKAETARTG